MMEMRSGKRSIDATPPGEIIHLDHGTDLVEGEEATTIEGSKVIRYSETYRGIPVYDSIASIGVDKEDGTYTGQASGQLLQDIPHDVTSVTPTLTREEALLLGKILFGGEVTRYSDEKVELIIYPVGHLATLAYEISFIAFEKESISRRMYILDANTGHLLKELNMLSSFHLKSTGGNTKFGKLQFGSSMPYLNVLVKNGKCVLANSNIEVYDLNQSNDIEKGDNPYTFDCSEGVHDMINGAYSPLSDAFFYANRVFDMYDNLVHTPVIRDLPVQLWVHYGKNAIVAQYSGPMLMFGDGLKDYFYPMVSADIIGHEFTHGFVEGHSGLEYSGQSGAVDEAFSDVAGEAAEVFIFGKNDFKSGEAVSMGYHVRDMCDPASDGRSIAHVRDYNDDMDVHYTSGVINKAACLITRSDDFDITTVFQIFAHANRFYWHPTTDYAQAACGIAKAAYDLGYDTEEISVAFETVGITVCSMENYTRTLHSDTTINNLHAKGNERIVFKFKVVEGETLKLYTMNGAGDVDVTVDRKRKLRGANPAYSSKSKGNLEMLKINLKLLNKGYITLAPKNNTMFNGVTFKLRIR